MTSATKVLIAAEIIQCVVTPENSEVTILISELEKMDKCPLRPLPEKHGRLGDLDAIMNKLAEDKRETFTKHDVWLMLSRYGAETIVEAEGE